jgi:hypothetical protein
MSKDLSKYFSLCLSLRKCRDSVTVVYLFSLISKLAVTDRCGKAVTCHTHKRDGAFLK